MLLNKNSIFVIANNNKKQMKGKRKRGFVEGKSGNPNGRKKGTPNKVTKEAKELVLIAIDKQSVKFNSTMESIRKKNPIEWAKIMVRLMDFVLPKKLDLTSKGKSVGIPVATWSK